MKREESAVVKLFQMARAGLYPEVNTVKAGICKRLQSP